MPYVFSISQPQNGVEETDCGVDDSQQNSIMYQWGRVDLKAQPAKMMKRNARGGSNTNLEIEKTVRVLTISSPISHTR